MDRDESLFSAGEIYRCSVCRYFCLQRIGMIILSTLCIAGLRISPALDLWACAESCIHFFTWTSTPLFLRHLCFYDNDVIFSSAKTFKYRGHACVKNTFRASNLKLTPTLQSVHRRGFRHRIFHILLHFINLSIPISFRTSPAYLTCITFRENLEESEVKPELCDPSAIRKASHKFSASTSPFRNLRFKTCLPWLGITNQIRFSLDVLPLRRT